MSEYRLATPEEGEELLQRARDWVDGSNRFRDVRSVPVSAIAEYLANQKGLTLYRSET